MYHFRISIFLTVLLIQGFLNGKGLEKRMERVPLLNNMEWGEEYSLAAYKADAGSVVRDPDISHVELPQSSASYLGAGESPERGGYNWNYSVENSAWYEAEKIKDTNLVTSIIQKLAVKKLDFATLRKDKSHCAVPGMESSFDSLGIFYNSDLKPLLSKECRYAGSAEASNLRGKKTFNILKKILDSDREGDSFPNEEFILVENSLLALKLLKKYWFIEGQEVREFFSAERIIKSIGRHLVHCYEGIYPNSSGFKTFIPDMDFLKKDSQTSHLHWCLSMVDQATERKILLRSMQKYFSNMLPARVKKEDTPSLKWGVLLHEDFYQFIQGFEPNLDRNYETEFGLLRTYLVHVLNHDSTNESLEGILSNFWISEFIFNYYGNILGHEFYYHDFYANIRFQNDMTRNFLKMQMTRNRFLESEETWWFDSSSSPVRLQDIHWINDLEGNDPKKVPEDYKKLKAEHKKFLITSKNYPKFYEFAKKLISIDVEINRNKPIHLLNGWLKPIYPAIDHHLTQGTSSKFQKMKGKLNTTKSVLRNKLLKSGSK